MSVPVTNDVPMTPPEEASAFPSAGIGAIPVPASGDAAAPGDQDRHFGTDHLMDDLKGRSIRGGAVTLAAQGGKFALKLGETIILARLLTPADFGLVAMVTAITGMVAMFKDAGLSMATVQRPKITHDQVSTLFWINVALSVLLMGLVAALAPLVVWLYGEPRLLGITLAVAGSFIFAGLGVQHTALLKRQMRFTSLAAVDLTTMAVAVLVAIVMAWHGAGYWALVGLIVAQPIVQFVLVWWMSGWRPGLPRRGCGVGPMLAFGGNLTGFDFVNYFSRNADNVLIGWWWGAGVLGLYSRAYELMMLPIATVRGPLISVALPAMSRLQNERLMYRRYYRRMTELLAFVSMPLAVFLFITSDALIGLAFGPNWLDASPIFQALALTAFLQPSAGLRGLVLLSSGDGRRYLRLGVGIALVTVAAFLVGIRWGPIGVAIAYGIANYAMLYPTLLYAFRSSPVVVADFFSAVAAPAASSLVAGAIAFCIVTILPLSINIEQICVSLVLFVFTYFLMVAVLPGGRELFFRYHSYTRILKSSSGAAK